MEHRSREIELSKDNIVRLIVGMAIITCLSYPYFGIAELTIALTLDILIILFLIYIYITVKKVMKVRKNGIIDVDKWVNLRKNDIEAYKEIDYIMPIDSGYSYKNKLFRLNEEDYLMLLSKRKEYGITDSGHIANIDCKIALELNEELLKYLVKEELLDEI